MLNAIINITHVRSVNLRNISAKKKEQSGFYIISLYLYYTYIYIIHVSYIVIYNITLYGIKM